MTPAIDRIQGEMERADSLLRAFSPPWDEQDLRPLLLLKDVLDAHQKALSDLVAIVEHEQRINTAQRGRIGALELGSVA